MSSDPGPNSKSAESSWKDRPVVRRVGWAVRWCVALAIVGFILREALSQWEQIKQTEADLDYALLAVAALCYFVGWIPSVIVMQRLIRVSGGTSTLLATARAYYCSHLGKYVPGKAAAPLIRAALLRDSGLSFITLAAVSVIETLAVMGVGLAVTLSLGSAVVSDEVWEQAPEFVQRMHEPIWLGTVVTATLLFAVLPLFVGAFRKVVRVALRSASAKVTESDQDQRAEGESDRAEYIDRMLSLPLLYRIAVGLVPCWLMHGLSLHCVLSAMGHGSFSVSVWLLCTVAVSGATSIGFLVLIAPGGLGVREGLIYAVLAPSIGSPIAASASVLLRAVWSLTELSVACAFYLLPIEENDDESGDRSDTGR